MDDYDYETGDAAGFLFLLLLVPAIVVVGYAIVAAVCLGPSFAAWFWVGGRRSEGAGLAAALVAGAAWGLSIWWLSRVLG